MKSKLYCAFDKVSEVFYPPQMAVNDDSIVRYLNHALNDEAIVPKKDISVYYVGDFDDNTGEVFYVNPTKIYDFREVIDEK